MNIWSQVDFAKLVEDMLGSIVDEKELAIFGGYCAEKDLIGFIPQWKVTFPFRIWEYVSEICFEKEKTYRKTSMLHCLNGVDCSVNTAT
jgi:ABC-type Mn2+/Zn2+ transport system ATPase subunit